jgi:hypothetical protein
MNMKTTNADKFLIGPTKLWLRWKEDRIAGRLRVKLK